MPAPGGTGEGDPVRIETDGPVAVIVVDNPPVNAASTAVRRGLLDAVSALAARADIAAVVIIGAGRTFIAGADIKEFGRPLLEPQLPAVIAAIEACPKPVVAAIHGAALGGGLEIAMGCDARIATTGAVVGLPEVKLGLIPGSGGTQRLPRLIGVARAIEVIASGRRIPVAEAVDAGIVDRQAGDDLWSSAVAYARTLSDKRIVSRLETPADAAGTVDIAAAAALRSARGIGAVAEAIATVRLAATMPFAEALLQERATFQRLREGAESAALRRLFFAERRSGGRPAAGVALRSVEQVGVIGLGLMGSGIAASVAVAGLDVVAIERDAEGLAAGIDRTGNTIDSIARRTGLSAPEREAARARIRPFADLAALSGVDLVIEAVAEDMSIKRAVFGKLDSLARPGAILTTNTSYLDVDALAAATGRPGDVAGLHFFSPAHVLRVVEVVRGAATTPDILATLVAFARRIGKIPVPAKADEGFIGNRILTAYRRQCDLLLEEGSYPADIDSALTEFGMAMGPYAVADLAGLDIAWQNRKRRAGGSDPRVRQFPAADRLCEMGRFGRKSGAGWYRYGEDGRRPLSDPLVHALIEQLSADAVIDRRLIGAAEIRERVLAAMVNEACLVLDRETADSPSAVDLVMVHGYGFPASEGGPLFWASRQPRAEFVAAVDRMVEATGWGCERAPNLSAVLDRVDV